MWKIKKHLPAIIFLLIITSFLRFYQLGDSHFYGDETKTLYWNKVIPAKEFLLSQRKGPIQFLATWTVETITGQFDEFAIRLPFALASTLAVLVLYLYLNNKFDQKTALLGSFAFSIFGFNIAFGRIAQYQSFLILFGLLGIYLTDLSKKYENKKLLLLAGTSLGLAMLSHYDAIFFILPSLYLIYKNYKKDVKAYILFLAPLIILSATFYIPNFVGGYMQEFTQGYILRRISGAYRKPSNSLFTFWLYNPSYVWIVILAFSVLGFFKTTLKDKIFFSIWFIVPFIIFEMFFAQPGTHIHNYMIPLIILSAIATKNSKKLQGIYAVALILAFVVSVKTYIPNFNDGYPWKYDQFYSGNTITKHHFFMYGFPYNREWIQIAEYLRGKGVKSFYTNDNITIGEWYLQGIPADKGNPHFYVSIVNGQEFRTAQTEKEFKYTKASGDSAHKKIYYLIKTITIDGEDVAYIYK